MTVLPSWPHIRGSRYDGCSDEVSLIDSWPSNGPLVIWKRPLGQGYSSFVGEGDRVYTQYQTILGQSVVCLNSQTGETVWSYHYAWPFEPAGLYPGPQSTPTLDGERLYYTAPQGIVGCLERDTGKLRWEFNLREKFQSPTVEFGYSCSPAVIDGKLYLPVGGPNASMVAIDGVNGSVIWQSGNEPISHIGALPITRNGRSLLVGYFKNALQIYDRLSGDILSDYRLSEGYDEHSSWPLYKEPYLWISAPFRNGSKLFEIRDKEGTIEVINRNQSNLMSNDVCSSILVGNHIYGFDLHDVQSKVHRPSKGTFRCLGFPNGKEVWSIGNPKERRHLDSKSTGSIGHASVLHADGKLILLNDMGDLILAHASHEKYDEIGRATVLAGDITWTQPMLLGGNLYIRNHTNAICVRLSKAPLVQGATNMPEGLETTSDLSLTPYRDLASTILSIEPEYAMTSPSKVWLLRWFVVTLFLGWGLSPFLAWTVCRVHKMFKGDITNVLCYRISYRVLAYGLGMAGTTVLGYLTGDFLFTWTLALAISLETLFYQVQFSRDRSVEPKPWISRAALLFFLITILVYFLLCRRLSLAFEWSFLIGFPAAIPFLYAAKTFADSNARGSRFKEYLMLVLAYCAFYWAGAGWLLLKYEDTEIHEIARDELVSFSRSDVSPRRGHLRDAIVRGFPSQGI